MPPTDQPARLRRLGDFEIVREIGRGGMGVVYEARQVSLNRRVALKVLAGGLAWTPKAVQRFRREAEAAAKLHHTNIVPVYATGEQDGTHFYAMELIDGPSLDHVIRRMRGQHVHDRESSPGEPASVSAGSNRRADAASHASLEATGPYVQGAPVAGATAQSSSSLGSGSGYFDTVARTIAEVADALEYAHQQGVVHRDMKPSNLLLSPSGRLSVNDFGLARLLEQPGMTMSGEFVGTPAYMSPEQITAGRAPLDHRTDIYSLGATLYELLTLERPFSGERRDEVIAQIMHKEPRPPRKANPKVPVDLETICLKALEKDPDRRYQTAGALADDLRRYVNRFAISARRVGPAERLRKWIKRHPGLAAGVALAVAAIVVAGFFAMQSWRDRRERIAAGIAARQQLLKEKMDQAQQHILQGDFPGGENAIQAAMTLGASDAWVGWRRGQIAFHRGEYEKAHHLLEPAQAQMPDNVAVGALLAHTGFESGRYGSTRINPQFRSLPPSTPEDHLYLGLDRSLWDPIGAVRSLDLAMTQQPSLIAHVLRARVLTSLAQETNDLAKIKDAMQDVTAAKSILRGNPSAVVESAHVHHVAAILYEQNKKPSQSEEALRIAREDADELARFPDLALAVWQRGVFLADDGREQEAFQVFEDGVRHKDLVGPLATEYAWLLYQKGKVAEAAEAIESHAPRGLFRDISRIVFFRELPDGPRRAGAICDQLSGEWPEILLIYRTLCLFYLGESAQARVELHQFQPQLDNAPKSIAAWFHAFKGYLTSPDAAAGEKLLQLAGRSRRVLAEMHMEMGVARLGDGDRAGARRHFEACLAVRNPYNIANTFSRGFLARMNNDPAWPPWIPAKK